MTVISGRGAFERLDEITGWAADTLVVASAGTVDRLGLRGVLPAGAALFTDFHPNPTADQALAAARARHEHRATLVVGVGGGSALDVAKAARALPADRAAAERVLRGTDGPRTDARLVLVPTTAGPGSEVTRFATLYRDGHKLSLDAAGVQADAALVDPALTDSCPPEQTWCCAFDAFAHAVESLWSSRATDESRAWAVAALDLLVPILEGAAPTPAADERDRLSAAALLAGRAIDRTRTTAAHALAYPLTTHLGVRHGHACALNLTWLAPMVETAAPDERTLPDPVLDTLRRLLRADGRDLGRVVTDLLAARGLPTRCGSANGTHLVDVVVAEGLASNRVSGTPIRLDPTAVRAAVRRLLVDPATGAAGEPHHRSTRAAAGGPGSPSRSRD
ncbi:iron-containing alcohol dehydrogenase [Actinokineospora auranticolor]|uniref:Alcohol dehydrogenase class IV n=1 Tax=Actinokineospora auranticolor TaxID=155976 RepID=A0A2S6GPJ5_9PSEU|nr:iron-containing alcohol dehydrogenase [Actinokineospora auranticolor]PPK67175.1 alcohol dehydrogenase class IV [Actinokineospora auranticolor]